MVGNPDLSGGSGPIWNWVLIFFYSVGQPILDKKYQDEKERREQKPSLIVTTTLLRGHTPLGPLVTANESHNTNNKHKLLLVL